MRISSAGWEGSIFRVVIVGEDDEERTAINTKAYRAKTHLRGKPKVTVHGDGTATLRFQNLNKNTVTRHLKGPILSGFRKVVGM